MPSKVLVALLCAALLVTVMGGKHEPEPEGEKASAEDCAKIHADMTALETKMKGNGCEKAVTMMADPSKMEEFCNSGCSGDIHKSMEMDTRNKTMCKPKAEDFGEVLEGALGGLMMGMGKMMVPTCRKNAEGKMCDGKEITDLYEKITKASQDANVPEGDMDAAKAEAAKSCADYAKMGCCYGSMVEKMMGAAGAMVAGFGGGGGAGHGHSGHGKMPKGEMLFDTAALAEAAALTMGCTGSHAMDGKFMPGTNHGDCKMTKGEPEPEPEGEKQPLEAMGKACREGDKPPAIIAQATNGNAGACADAKAGDFTRFGKKPADYCCKFGGNAACDKPPAIIAQATNGDANACADAKAGDFTRAGKKPADYCCKFGGNAMGGAMKAGGMGGKDHMSEAKATAMQMMKMLKEACPAAKLDACEGPKGEKGAKGEPEPEPEPEGEKGAKVKGADGSPMTTTTTAPPVATTASSASSMAASLFSAAALALLSCAAL